MTKEKSDGRNACLNRIDRRDTPLALAVRMKSSCSVVIRSVRSSRWYTAAAGMASVSAGRIIAWRRDRNGSSAWYTSGNQPSLIDRKYDTMIASAKFGMEIIRNAPTVDTLSALEFALEADHSAHGRAIVKGHELGRG